MKNTLVTAIYNTSPHSRMGGRGYDFELYKAPFRNIISLGCNIVVFSHQPVIDVIIKFFDDYNFSNYKIIDYDLNNYENSDLVYELKETEQIIDKNGLKEGNSFMTNDRNYHLCLSKIYFLKEAIKNKYFNSMNHYWIDASLFHHGIFPETVGGIEKMVKVVDERYYPLNKDNICNPNLISKLEDKNLTKLVMIGLDNYYAARQWFGNYTDKPKPTHIIGGFFGGNNKIVNSLCDDFTKLTSQILKDGNLTLEEEILSLLYVMKYHKYKYIDFDAWYHDVPTVPNYFGTPSSAKSFYKVFI